MVSLTADDATGPAGAIAALEGGAGAGGAVGTAGAAGSSGTGAAAGTSASAAAGTSEGGGTSALAGAGGMQGDDANGCSCQIPGSTRPSQGGAGIGAVLLLALVGAFRRRPASRV